MSVKEVYDEMAKEFKLIKRPYEKDLLLGFGERVRLATIKEILLLLSALEEELPKTYRMIKLTYEKDLLGASK